MQTAKERLSAFAVDLPYRMPGFPGATSTQTARQQLGMKYVGIPFGMPGAAAAGRKKRILRMGTQMGSQRGF